MPFCAFCSHSCKTVFHFAMTSVIVEYMQLCLICNCQLNSFPVDFSLLKPDKRLSAVEGILRILIESRFGPNSTVLHIPDFRHPCGNVPVVYNDSNLPNLGSGLSDALSREQDKVFSDAHRARPTGQRQIPVYVNTVKHTLHGCSPSTLGRGSPTPESRRWIPVRQVKLLNC